MNLKTQERPRTTQEIEGIHLATTGSVIVSPYASSVPASEQPSNSKIFIVFGAVMTALLGGTAIGWMIATHLAQAKTEKAELAASAAKFDLVQNQTQIDNFCRQNASPNFLKR